MHGRRRAAVGQARRGAAARGFTLLFGYVFVLLGFLTMLLLWKENIAYWKVGLGYAFVGIGVGLAGTPASHSLTGSVPVKRVGMASGTADLQRDLGGAIMQSIFGALLTAGYAAAAGAAIAVLRQERQRAASQAELTKSFSSAADTAARYPASIQDQIIAGAKTAFLQGDQWAYLAGIVAVAARRARSSSSSSRSATRSSGCWRPTAPRTGDLAQAPISAATRPDAAASCSAR